MDEPITPSGSAKSLEYNLISGFRLLQGLPGVKWKTGRAHEYFKTGCQAAWLNGVLHCSENEHLLADLVPEIIDFFRTQNSSAVWRVGESSSNREQLTALLDLHGLDKSSSSPEMILDLTDFEADVSFQLECRALTSELIKEWMKPFAVCFGLSEADIPFFESYVAKILSRPEHGFRNFIGLVDEKVVSCGSVSLSGSVPVIYNIATLPLYRGSGFGTAMTTHLALQAKESGFKQIGLFATAAGFKMYQRIGFSVISQMDNYLIK